MLSHWFCNRWIYQLSHLRFTSSLFTNLVLFSFRDGFVSLQEYMAFMISRETENVQSAREVIEAFKALTTGDKPYITANELFAVSSRLPINTFVTGLTREIILLQTHGYLCQWRLP